MKNIKALFNLKKDFQKLEQNGTVEQFVQFTKGVVISAAQKEMDSQSKKELVLSVVKGFVLKSITSVNPLLGAVITYLVPFIVEHLYQALKTYVDGLTIQPS